MAILTSIQGGRTGSVVEKIESRLGRARAELETWRREREVYNRTVFELQALSDRDLADLGIARSNIHRIARDAAIGE